MGMDWKIERSTGASFWAVTGKVSNLVWSFPHPENEALAAVFSGTFESGI
jgi:hypothetical protein